MGVVGDVATPLSQHADGRHWLTVRDTWGTPGGGGGGGRKPLSPPEGVGVRGSSPPRDWRLFQEAPSR